MPLSEHEQRLLDQIEQALYQEDPKFASVVRSTDLKTLTRRRLRRSGALFAVGFVVLFLGVPTQQFAIGVAGFVIMLVALLMAMAAWKRVTHPGQPDLQLVGQEPRRPRGAGRRKPAKRGRTQGAPSQGGVLKRLESRWQRRWDERGGL